MTPRPYTPRPYQQVVTDFIINTPRCAPMVFMGAGKTVSTLTALDALSVVEPGPTLILGPKRVARDVWTNEARKWQHLQGLEIAAMIGEPDERRAALRRDVPFHTINYDNLQWLETELQGRWPWRNVVADELTRLKGTRVQQGSKRAQALKRAANGRIQRFIGLTGTPTPNGLFDLWGQMYWIDGGRRLGQSYDAFVRRWFYSPVRGGDEDSRQVLPFKHAADEIYARIADVCLSLNAKDYFDLRDPIVRTIEVTLPPKARKHYREIQKDYFTELDGHEIEAFNAASKSIKCLQAASGALYHDDKGNWTPLHDEKLDALESVLEEANGMPLLVAYHFKSDLARLLKRFPDAAVLSTDAGMRRFRAGSASLGLAHPASMGHGIDGLQDVTNILVYFSHWWALEERQQMLERIGPVRQMQSGHDRPVYVYNLVAKGTLDEAVLDRHEGKRSVQDALLAYMDHSRRSAT